MPGDRAGTNDVGDRGVAHEPSGVTVQSTEERVKIMSGTEKKDPPMYPWHMLLALALACAKPAPTAIPRALQTEAGLTAQLVTEGSLPERIAPQDSAQWVLFYAGEQRGDIAPCGCPSRPRGGLPRTASTIDASGPALFVNAGGWLDGGIGLDGNPIPEAELKNRWMVRGLELMSPAAVHVGFEDLAALPDALKAVTSLPLISANLRGPGIEQVIYIEHRGLQFAFTGVSHTGHRSISTPDYERLDPVQAGQNALNNLKPDVDRVVLFSHGATDAAKKLAKSGRIDVVIDTQSHRGFDAPFRVGKALWVRSHAQGLRLGELRVGDAEVVDRKIDMDDALPDHPEMRVLADQAKSEIEALKVRMFGP
jgi:2',3'-cyclic-nucleotide 2'-phosphodiesterase (5'-nucleotidase family)